MPYLKLNPIYSQSYKDTTYRYCNDFARRCQKTQSYLAARNNQNDPSRIIQQHTIAKIAECVAYKYLKEIGYETTKPDFKVYPPGQKSFSSDLKYHSLNIHVKSLDTSALNQYGFSWAFEMHDNPKGILVLCYTNTNDQVVDIVGIIDSNDATYGPGRGTAENKKFILDWDIIDINTNNLRKLDEEKKLSYGITNSTQKKV